jgi:hypothetical protein
VKISLVISVVAARKVFHGHTSGYLLGKGANPNTADGSFISKYVDFARPKI